MACSPTKIKRTDNYATVKTISRSRSEFVSAQTAAGVRVLPLYRASMGGVAVDVAPEAVEQETEKQIEAHRLMTHPG